MKSTFFCCVFTSLLLFALTVNPLAANVSELGDIDFSALDAVIQAQMKKHGLPGVTLAVVEGNQIAYLKGYGTAGKNRTMTPQTQMFIGSQSKSFTALAITQLAELGKLDLNAPVRTYIPWFRIANETASGEITINHLLHHTSGLSDSGYGILLPLDATSEQAVRSLAKAELTAPVGKEHQYFNMGYIVLSHIVELTSGKSYANYIQDHILMPLGMESSTADPTAAHSLAQGYTRLFGFSIPMSQQVPVYATGAGYIISTADDMARFALAMQNGGSGLVSPEMHTRIFSPGLGSYGMGWFIEEGGTRVFHGGANDTFRTEVNLFPLRERSFVLLSNQGCQMDHFISASQLTRSVEALVLGKTPLPVDEGWSVRWVGWSLGILVLALIGLHTRNFLALRGWNERTRNMPMTKKIMDVAISFVIPTVILIVIYSQVKSFYGYRFNPWTNLVNLRLGLPDVFILMLVGTLPDYVQGGIKLSMLRK